MSKLVPKTKKLAYKCARCFITETDKLAWFVGNTLFNESLLCRTCWQGQFNFLTERERKEWGFYVPKKPR
ncbi:hypothetical protein [uncultured Mediterranean phage uvDeep-CGR2-AD8-C175]|nr:hypothetical protein [uncultured Mediterranean phage uvDeep-CGR2-AD8-C175]